MLNYSEKELIKQLHEFSNGELSFDEITPDGLIATHSNHKRQELVVPTKDLKTVAEKKVLGWEPKRGKCGFLVRAPETWLCDLSDPYKVQKYGIVENFALYMMLNNLKSKGEINDVLEKSKEDIKNLRLYHLEGEALETETRIAGNNETGLKQAKENIVRLLKKRPEWREYLKEAQNRLKPRKLCAKHQKIEELKPITQQFYKSIKDIHDEIAILSGKVEIACNGIWKSIPSADVYIFVPNAGYRLALGFVDTRERYDDVMFWEYHAGQTMSLPENHLFFKPLENKKVATIDISYSGSTLNTLHQLVSKEGGRPSKIAVFPKSRRAIQGSEYFIFLDRTIQSEKVNSFNKDWPANVYCDVVNNRYINWV